MLFIVTVNQTKYLLSAAALETITNVLGTSEHLHVKWVGDGKGDNGEAYITRLASMRTAFSVEVMSEDQYNTLKLLREVSA